MILASIVSNISPSSILPREHSTRRAMQHRFGDGVTGWHPGVAPQNRLTASAWTVATKLLTLNEQRSGITATDFSEEIMSHLREAMTFLKRKKFAPLPPARGSLNTCHLRVDGGTWPLEAIIIIRPTEKNRHELSWSYRILARPSLDLRASGTGHTGDIEQMVRGFVSVLTTAASVAQPD